MSLKGKKILIGICGGIAAYKVSYLIRALIKGGAEVKVILTEDARAFVTPLTMATLSRNPVMGSLYNEQDGSWNNHVELGLWADVMLIAPASANTLAKMAHGQSDNLLLTSYLSMRCPVLAAPAMDLDMWEHPATQSNLATLIDHGVRIIEPGSGELASGLVGKGRMAEPEDLEAQIRQLFETEQGGALEGMTALVTAGPTQEALDPVRFIGNHSTGRMGIELAEALARQGAKVQLVKGPTNLSSKHSGVEESPVKSAADMYAACESRFGQADIFIAAAAVADYTPASVSDTKIKKSGDGSAMELELVRTTDILGTLAAGKSDQQIVVGFALETDNEIENAIGKLERKNLDFVVLNSMRDKGAGFKGSTNKIRIIESRDSIHEFPLKSKTEVAEDIVNHVIRKLQDSKSTSSAELAG